MRQLQDLFLLTETSGKDNKILRFCSHEVAEFGNAATALITARVTAKASGASLPHDDIESFSRSNAVFLPETVVRRARM
jgi:hypothetical protein